MADDMDDLFTGIEGDKLFDSAREQFSSMMLTLTIMNLTLPKTRRGRIRFTRCVDTLKKMETELLKLLDILEKEKVVN